MDNDTQAKGVLYRFSSTPTTLKMAPNPKQQKGA
jgi:hypothetical protein